VNTISKIFVVIALIIMILGFIPLLGWLNWLVMPLSGIGLLLGIFADKQDRVKLNAIVLIVSAIRLSIGGGVI
jgi:hypothetical protein